MTVTAVPYPSPAPLGRGAERAIAFGGGGEWFTAFCLAYVNELRQGGVDLSRADLVVGTSAGSACGTFVATDGGEAAYAQWTQLAAHPEVLAREVPVDAPTPSRLRAIDLMAGAADTGTETIVGLGRAAMAAHNASPDGYVASVHRLLGAPAAWPSRVHHTTAVDCYTGERLLVGPDSGIPIEAAVAASSSVPGVNGPIWLDDRLAMDGGVSPSSTHADLLVGARRAVVFTLMSLTAEDVAALPPTPFGMAEKAHPGNANAEAAMIEAAGGRAFVVVGNPPAGTDFMDPAQLADAMARGRSQAARDRDALAALWND
jgi:NTE family protein